MSAPQTRKEEEERCDTNVHICNAHAAECSCSEVRVWEGAWQGVPGRLGVDYCCFVVFTVGRVHLLSQWQ